MTKRTPNPKRVPRYMRLSVPPAPSVYGNGNPAYTLSLTVPLLNDDGTIHEDASGNVVKVSITETYVWNQNHRSRWKAGKGQWSVPETVEYKSFLRCRQFGCIRKWKSDTYMGWGIYFDGQHANVLGRGINSEGQLVDVKICKFVEGNKGIWHGYPIDYRRKKEDVICDNALYYWKKLQLIDKSEINDIRNQEDSSLT